MEEHKAENAGQSQNKKAVAEQASEETAYLLRNPRNARRLLESIAVLESGGGVERDLSYD